MTSPPLPAPLPSPPEVVPARAGAGRPGAVLWAIAAGLAARLVALGFAPLTMDEAYHVDWARHLQPGYLDHPPAVAWLMAVPLRLLGSSPLVASRSVARPGLAGRLGWYATRTVHHVLGWVA